MERANRIKIKRSMPLSLFIVGTYSLLLICSSTLTDMVYAQILPKLQAPSTTTNTIPKSTQQVLPKLHLVKITSPTKGQQVSVGKDLVISGTSADNVTSDCKVSLKVNGIKPYHDALPVGQNDYSKWSFTLTPAYTTLKEGQNKISAHFACTDNPSLISKNSVNVTGVTATGASIP